MNKRVIAIHLPQFHPFLENDEWWGKGFTEWTNVTKAKPRFLGHYQPHLPSDTGFYDLRLPEAREMQANMAREYGIYGFCYYHYWFNGKKLLEKPLEQMLMTPEVDIPFCLCWANETWTRTWADKNKQVLIKQTYGDKKMWENHFYYLLDYFKDSRYIKIDDCPLLVIYRPYNIDKCEEMLTFWSNLAIQNGLKGIKFAYQDRNYNHLLDKGGYLFDYGIEYQPQIVMDELQHTIPCYINRVANIIADRLPVLRNRYTYMTLSYDQLWKRILQKKPRDEKMIPGAFVDWDNTPRYKNRGSIVSGVTPEKFKFYLSQQIKRTKEIYKKDMLFLFAWNEWGEGGYLEPDKRNGFRMLEAIKEAIEENNEII